MININTYIAKTSSVDDYFKDLDSPEKYFVNIKDDSDLKTLNNMLTKNKSTYLNGTILILINNCEVVTFIDWDDLDLMWPSFITMVLDYLKDGSYAKTEHFSNGQEWTMKKINSSAENQIIFSVHRAKPLYELELNLPVEQKTTGICSEALFLNTFLNVADEYIKFRDKDSRSQNLIDAKSKLTEIKNYLI